MKTLFSWVAAAPFLYYCLGLLTLLGFSLLAFIPTRAVKDRKFEWLFLVLAGCTLFVWRCPAILWTQPMNIDEGHSVACALKATYDFAPWRGFDGTTSGPLNFYILALPKLFGAEITFFSTRMIGCCLLMGGIYALYFIAKWTHGGPIARLSIIPPVAFLALTWEWDFLHYSSEYFPIFLTTTGIAAGAYLATGERGKICRLVACLCGGLLLGSAGFAKLQSLPIAAVGAVFIIGMIWVSGASPRQRWTEIGTFLISLALVPGLIVISLLRTGDLNDAYISYIGCAKVIVASGTTVGLKFFFTDAFSYTAFEVCSLLVIVSGVIALGGGWRPTKRSASIAVCAIGFLFTSLLVILVARHAFAHYLLFSVIPLSYAVATVLRFTQDANRWRGKYVLISAGLIVLFVLPALSLSMAHPSPYLGVVHDMFLRAGRDLSLPLPLADTAIEVRAIRKYAPPGTRVAIWGWMPHYYAQTQTIMATRDSHTLREVDGGPYQEYFRKRFMSALRAQPPPVFIDAVAPVSWGLLDRTNYGFETFPALASFIRDNYLLKEDVEGVRIYVLSKGKRPPETENHRG